jgi:large subunit ribosomal protein L24
LLETIKVLKEVLRVDRENKAIVEGVNMVSKHTKPSPQGGIEKKLLFKYLTYL